jgi:hypothetical protein
MSVLLKSLYNQGLISEDAYHHSLDNLQIVIDFEGALGYDGVKNKSEVEPNGCI